MAALILKQIERGQVTWGATDTSKTVTLTTALTDVAKTILLFNARSGSGSPIDYHVLGKVSSTTQIVFERAATPNDSTCIVEYQVIEFVQGITVQHFAFNQATTTVNTAITAVDLAKTFIIMTFRSTGSTLGADDFMMAQLTSTTNLETTAGTTATAQNMAVQVVQIDEASVQTMTGSYGTGATADLTVTTIDPAKTFWFFTAKQSTGNVVGSGIPYLAYVNTTTLRFTRTSASSVDWTYVTYVVSLSAGVTVQNIATTIASGAATGSPTITAITVKDTALNINGLYQHFVSCDSSDDDAGGFAITLSGLTTTAFTATRVDSPALVATTNVQVLSFVSSVTFVSLIFDCD